MFNALHKCVGAFVVINYKISLSLPFNYSNDEEGKVLLGKLGRINKPLEIGFRGIYTLT